METKTSESLYGISGLHNLGNTCYMNTIIQCLSNTLYFRETILHTDLEQVLKRKLIEKLNLRNQPNAELQVAELCKDTITYQLVKLIAMMWDENANITPTTFKNILGKKMKIFVGNQQHDAQEALNSILDTIHEEISVPTDIKFTDFEKTFAELQEEKKKVEKVFNDASKSQEDKYKAYSNYIAYKNNHNDAVTILQSYRCWKKFVEKGHSLITDIFTGMLYSSLMCPNCNFKSDKFDPYSSIQLSLPNQQAEINLYDCLQTYCKSEKLDDDNKWKCKICKSSVNAIKYMSIWEHPNVLVIQLKRFENNKGTLTKISTPVSFPVELNIEPFITPIHKRGKYTYSLYAVANHSGSVNGGHYYAYCKNSIDKKWYEFNDSSAKEMKESEVMSRNAYILFYEQNF